MERRVCDLHHMSGGVAVVWIGLLGQFVRPARDQRAYLLTCSDSA